MRFPGNLRYSRKLNKLLVFWGKFQMDKSTHEVRIEQWMTIIRQCQSRPEGQSAKAWLAENGVNEKQYYYRLRQIRKKAYEEMKDKPLSLSSRNETEGTREVTFAEIPALSNDAVSCQQTADISGFRADAVVRLGAATIAVSNTISAELLGRIFEAVNHAC